MRGTSWSELFSQKLARQANDIEEPNVAIRALTQVMQSYRDQENTIIWQAASQWQLPRQLTSTLFRLRFADGTVVSYLSAFGFGIDNHENIYAASWLGKRPVVEFSVDESISQGHEQHAGHTWYMIKCKLEAAVGSKQPFSEVDDRYRFFGHQDGERALEWCSPRRLAQLRMSLHDPIKRVLGKTRYQALFQDCPFAQHAGPSGTTARLGKWLARLSKAINAGDVPPLVCAVSLLMFRGPPRVARRYDKPGVARMALQRLGDFEVARDPVPYWMSDEALKQFDTRQDEDKLEESAWPQPKSQAPDSEESLANSTTEGLPWKPSTAIARNGCREDPGHRSDSGGAAEQASSGEAPDEAMATKSFSERLAEMEEDGSDISDDGIEVVPAPYLLGFENGISSGDSAEAWVVREL